MYLIKYFFTVSVVTLIICQSATASDAKGSFSKKVKEGETTFDISSRPIKGYAGHILSIGMLRGGKKIAGARADVDYLPKSAKAVHLTDNTTPELALLSRTSGKNATEMLDVYWFDGAKLHQSSLPKLEEKSGYKGGDHLYFEDRLIVRTVPVYLDGDQLEKPTGGTRSFRYNFKGGVFSLYTGGEKTANSSDILPVKNSSVDVKPPSVETKPVVSTTSLAITEIVANKTGMEIRANGEITKYKTFFMTDPELIIIDIFGAVSSLAGKKVPINRFGIGKLRVVESKGSLRVTIDTTNRTFESYKLKSYGNSLYVYFLE